MNLEAKRRSDAAFEALNAELAKLNDKLDADDQKLLRESQEAWLAHMTAFSLLEANAAKGGSMHSSLYGGAADALIQKRTREIQDCLRQESLGIPAKRKRRPR